MVTRKEVTMDNYTSPLTQSDPFVFVRNDPWDAQLVSF